MHTNRPISIFACCSLFVAATTTCLHAAGGPDQQAPAGKPGQEGQVHLTPPVPPTPAAAGQLVYARPFTLETGFAFDWRKERPTVDAGYLLVIRVPSDYVYPRQVAAPVLMVGNQVAELMNVGYASGTVVVIVPAPRKADGSVDLDLAAQPIHFAPPALPESIDQATADALRQLAVDSGIRPASAANVRQAFAAGGAVARLVDREGLDRVVGAVLRTYVPDESERADQLEGRFDSAPRVVKP